MITVSSPGEVNTLPLIVPQINISSVGVTTTDTTGNTYAEPAGQTRVTITATRTRQIAMNLSGHVNAGTGSFIMRNFTDAADLSTAATTTSTSEVVLTAKSSAAATNSGDAITIRVKNSGAGNTVTIDRGGLVESDDSSQAAFSSTGIRNMINSGAGITGYIRNMSVALLQVTTGATISVQPVYLFKTGTENGTVLNENFSTVFTEAQAGTVFALTGHKYRHSPATSQVISMNVTAISGTFIIGDSYDYWSTSI